MRNTKDRSSQVALSILGVFAAQCVVLVALRAAIFEYGWRDLASPSRLLSLPGVAVYDVVAAGVGTILILSLSLWLPKAPARLLLAVCWLWAVTLVILGLVNVEFFRRVGAPLDYRWLYYADFLSDLTERKAFADALTIRFWTTLIACLALLYFGFRCFRAFLKTLTARYAVPFSAVLMGAAFLCATYVGYFCWRIQQSGIPDAKLANPILSIVATAFEDEMPALFDMVPRYAPDHAAGNRRAEPEQESKRSIAVAATSPNVLIVVLESVSVEHLEPYGGLYPVTPTLKSYRSRSLTFTGVYSHAPSTNKAVVSLLGSVYPWLSYRSLTKEHADLRLRPISGVLREKGYRTGFFSSADLRFQNMEGFLLHQDFDIVQDYRGRGVGSAEMRSPRRDWDYLDGSFDATTAASLLDWVRAEPDRPFFSVLWTAATHFPYFVRGPGTDYGVDDPYLSRYLDALKETDAAVGFLLDRLDASNLLHNTLVVVVGDHGEAFGRHGHYGHASSIYEENVKIPLMLIHDKFSGGEQSDVVGGMIDVAPTILGLLQHAIPSEWQGRSLLDAGRSPRTYFFSPWTEPQFGFREGRLKYLLNTAKRKYEVYDVVSDPWESQNIFEDHANTKDMIDHRLAAWVTYQRTLIRSLVGERRR